jgi:hypothetical protein
MTDHSNEAPGQHWVAGEDDVEGHKVFAGEEPGYARADDVPSSHRSGLRDDEDDVEGHVVRAAKAPGAFRTEEAPGFTRSALDDGDDVEGHKQV